MDWFNYYGLVFVTVLLIPNIVYAIKNKDGFNGNYHNKTAEVFEQIGRYACFILMVFNIPYTYIGFWFSYGLTVYLVVNSALVFAYCFIWILLWKNSGKVKALLLSIIPSIMFIFSGVMIASIPLVLFSIIFAVSHILISVKNSDSDNSLSKTRKNNSAF